MPLQCSSCNTTGMVLTVISRLHGGKQRKEVKNVWSPKNVAQAQGQDPYIGPVVDRLSRAWKKPPDKKPGTRLHRGGKGKNWSQIGKILVSKVSLAEGWGGGGRAVEPGDMPLVPPFHDTRFWYHTLIGQMSSRWQIRGAVDSIVLF